MDTMIGDALALGWVLGPGLALAAVVGLASAWLRGRVSAVSRIYSADLAATGALLVILAGLHAAAARGMVSVEGRFAFYLDAAFLHLAAYLAAALLALGLMRILPRRDGTDRSTPDPATVR